VGIPRRGERLTDFWWSYADVTRAWLKDPGWEPDDGTPIVCVRFRLIEPLPSS
jgi:hypothetical protein